MQENIHYSVCELLLTNKINISLFLHSPENMVVVFSEKKNTFKEEQNWFILINQ